MITAKHIKDSKAISDTAKQWALDNLDYINSSNKLLGSSLKVEKGEKEGFYTSILYLQPADKVAIRTLCAGAKMGGCLKDCLISSGQLGMTTGQRAATRRTIIYLLDSDRFYSMLRKEISSLYRKHGEQLAIRLNGTSDIDFSDFIKTMPHVRFYDYTKIYRRLTNNRLSNYDLTYSGSAFSRKSIEITGRAIRDGHRVAIAFNTAERKGEFPIPKNLLDFDQTDLRFLDRKGLGALKCKGGSVAKRLASMGKANFFFTPKTYSQLNNIIARG
jgi:hypothetical protein